MFGVSFASNHMLSTTAGYRRLNKVAVQRQTVHLLLRNTFYLRHVNRHLPLQQSYKLTKEPINL